MSEIDGVQCRKFGDDATGLECFITVSAPADKTFAQQLETIEGRYAAVLEREGLSPDSSVFRRVFLSDVLNQAESVRRSRLTDEMTAVSIVQQAPLRGSKIELLAYHVQGRAPLVKSRIAPKHLLVERNGNRHLWSTRLCTCDAETQISAEKQTRDIFVDLIDTLAKFGSTLLDNCVRTWIYMKNVDVFYKGMVDARRDIFKLQGLTSHTHYIASTGIEGACSHRWDIVSMDAYANLSLVRGQTSYLNDFDRLCPTHDYGVTFERGTRIAYADRAHHFISGTASIDSHGDVVHVGDVMLQLERAVENVEALLGSGHAALSDLMYLIVYLRDPSDAEAVDRWFGAHFPDLPIAVVLGAVCRPAWLVEIEGVAVAPHADQRLPSF